MSDSLVVKAKIKDVITSAKTRVTNVAGDFPETLSEEVGKLIKKACERADANDRKTVMAKDL